MNRRSFFSMLGALVAAPAAALSGARLSNKPQKIRSDWVANGLVGVADNRSLETYMRDELRRELYGAGRQVRLVRASRRIEAHSLVVWDREDSSGIPRVRPARSTEDMNSHIRVGKAAITNCAVDQHHYTVANTRGGMVRIV